MQRTRRKGSACMPARTKPYWLDISPSGSYGVSNRVLDWFDMSELKHMKCEACQRGAPRVTAEESRTLHTQVPDWALVERDGIQRLERAFAFPDFGDALAFTNAVGALAEEEGHHPALLTEWGSVTVTWWTHKIRGLHQNDFIMAAKTDQLFP